MVVQSVLLLERDHLSKSRMHVVSESFSKLLFTLFFSVTLCQVLKGHCRDEVMVMAELEWSVFCGVCGVKWVFGVSYICLVHQI